MRSRGLNFRDDADEAAQPVENHRAPPLAEDLIIDAQRLDHGEGGAGLGLEDVFGAADGGDAASVFVDAGGFNDQARNIITLVSV